MSLEPTLTDRIDIVRSVMGAWAAHDVDGVIAHMHPDIEWHYHVGSEPVRGTGAMVEFLSNLAGHQLDLEWKLIRAAETDDAVLLEGTDDYRNPQGVRVQVPYMGVYEFTDADHPTLVTHWRDYLDMRIMLRAEKGEGIADWLVPLVDRPPT